MAVLLMVLLIATVVLGYFFIQGASSQTPEQRLLGICQGDPGQAERLLAYEMRRAPGISRTEAAARAIDSRRRDNR